MTRAGICAIWRWSILLTLTLCYLNLYRLQGWPELPVLKAIEIHETKAIAAFYLSCLLSLIVCLNGYLAYQWQNLPADERTPRPLPPTFPEAWIRTWSTSYRVMRGATVFGAFILPIYLIGHATREVLSHGKVFKLDELKSPEPYHGVLGAMVRGVRPDHLMSKIGDTSGITWSPLISPLLWGILVASAVGLSLLVLWRSRNIR